MTFADSEAIFLGEQASVWHSLCSDQAVSTRSQIQQNLAVSPFSFAQVQSIVDAVMQDAEAPVLEIYPLGIIAGNNSEWESFCFVCFFYVVECTITVELNCFGFWIQSCRNTQSTADSNKQNLLGQIGAVANLHDLVRSSNQSAVFAAIIGRNVFQNPVPQNFRICNECFLLCFIKGSGQSCSPCSQFFVGNARGEDVWNINVFWKIALWASFCHVAFQYISAQVGLILYSQDIQQFCSEFTVCIIRSSLEEFFYLRSVAFCVKQCFCSVFSADTV